MFAFDNFGKKKTFSYISKQLRKPAYYFKGYQKYFNDLTGPLT